MKKLITSIAALVFFVGLTSAAETTANAGKAENNANSLGVTSRSLAAIVEENVALRIKIEEMTEQSENLKSKLDYSNMMHTTLTNLKQKEIETIEENRNDQLRYAQMMNTTLLNLNTVLANAK